MTIRARASSSTKDYLLSIPLPEATDTYTVISHGFVIDHALAELTHKGFEVERELYRCSKSGDVAQGIYHLKYGSDPEMGMMFAWSNSYDKSMRFKCAIGGYVFVCMNGVVSGNMGSWARRHSGTADTETNNMMLHQINSADSYYNQLVIDKQAMKHIIMTPRAQAELMGRVYFEHGLLTSEQLNVVKSEIKKPSFDYNTDKDSLWQLYNAMTYSLQKANPKTWMDQQRLIHWLITNDYITDATQVIEEPSMNDESIITNQIDLVDSIAEIESEQQ